MLIYKTDKHTEIIAVYDVILESDSGPSVERFRARLRLHNV